MNHLFVPLQQASDLKEIGFDEKCFTVFYEGENELRGESHFLYSRDIKAPLYQQAFDWFREKHGYIHTICRVYNWNKEIPEYEGFCIYIGSKDPKVKLKCNDHFISNFYQDYREAELVVLKTLIEIVKNDNTTRS